MLSPATWLLIGLACLVSSISAWPKIGTAKTPRAGPRAWALPGMAKNPPHPLSLAHDVDLFAACLHAGLGPAQAAAAVGKVSEIDAWQEVAALLSVGVPAASAWEAIRAVEGLEELATLTTLSEQSGAAIASGATRLAATLRERAADAATARAERAGVFIALPLALCFLPAFIVLGLTPIVISLGGQLLAQ